MSRGTRTVETTIPIRIAPDGRVAAKLLPGPKPWVPIHGGRRPLTEAWPDRIAQRWRRAPLEPSPTPRRPRCLCPECAA